MFHLKSVPNHPEDELDLNVAEDEQFSPNKLRAQLERLYMGAVSLEEIVRILVLTIADTWIYHVQTTYLAPSIVARTQTNRRILHRK